ncbi:MULTISPECIES: zinc-binding dehydrogenase [unclassified Chelatococcus]|uniref:zinc-binding dehydrogenase n=1 Tax=unclassified Chelatococcus TaxID=2638111 RepID=UPI001BCDFCAD|nr:MULTISPECIES: zinc-binding dehydrogenase [unclassified Chelatococcus]MBS7701046.1 zinc-binding dehydrogenase [Chelatococcus sp. YT9]MBX3555579.1 zinc-binding dehydrogenase [Chelatococcus sp.]
MRMVAAVMYEQGLPTPYAESTPFRIEEVSLEGPGEGEVLVEIAAAGLCHSDLSQVAGLRKRKLPVVGGHEGAGIVREVGRGVTAVRPGDHVVMTAVSSCGHCRPCSESRPVLCESVTVPRTQGLLSNGARRLTLRGEPVYHYSGVSSFAQYAVTVPNSLIVMDPAIPLDVAAMFGCAVVTGAGCVFNSAKVKPGQSIAVLGLGGVGLNAVMAARIAGAAHIIGIDINETKFPLAQELGATHVFSALDPQVVEKVRDLTQGGVDFAFEISGAKAAMSSANAMTRKGGEIICVGLGASNDMYQYAHAALVSEEKVFRGSFMGSCVPERDIPRYLGLYQEGVLPVNRLKSDTMGFEGLNLSLDRLDRGEVVRQVLLPNG